MGEAYKKMSIPIIHSAIAGGLFGGAYGLIFGRVHRENAIPAAVGLSLFVPLTLYAKEPMFWPPLAFVMMATWVVASAFPHKPNE
jgi:hypothetical protein